MLTGTELTKADLQGLVTGWGGVGWTAAHDTAQAIGGAAAGWISAVLSPKVALLLALPLVIANAFTAAHPVLRTFTSLGPGMAAGATAIATHNWITAGKSKRATLRAA